MTSQPLYDFLKTLIRDWGQIPLEGGTKGSLGDVPVDIAANSLIGKISRFVEGHSQGRLASLQVGDVFSSPGRDFAVEIASIEQPGKVLVKFTSSCGDDTRLINLMILLDVIDRLELKKVCRADVGVKSEPISSNDAVGKLE